MARHQVKNGPLGTPKAPKRKRTKMKKIKKNNPKEAEPSREKNPPKDKSPPKDKRPSKDSHKAVKVEGSDRPTAKGKKAKKQRRKSKHRREASPSRSPNHSRSRSPNNLARPVVSRRASSSYTRQRSPSNSPRSRSPARPSGAGAAPKSRTKSPPKRDQSQDPKLRNQIRQPRKDREPNERDRDAAGAAAKNPQFVPLTYINRDESEGFQLGPIATCYRGHVVKLGKLVQTPNNHRLGCAHCDCELVPSRICTVCHDCEPSFIACLDCSLNLLADKTFAH
jgi:hypothetical protein